MWFPGLILLMVMVLQVFGYMWARESSQSAARYGVYHARVYEGSDQEAIAQTRAYLSQVATPLVQDPGITVNRTGLDVSVTITARPRQIPLPVLRMPDFTVHATGRLEQFTPGR